MPLHPAVGGLVLYSTMGTPVFGTNPRIHNNGYGKPKLSSGVLRLVVKNIPIHSGCYKLSVWLGDWQTDYDSKKDVLAFEFKAGQANRNMPSPESIGFLNVDAHWSVQEQDNHD